MIMSHHNRNFHQKSLRNKGKNHFIRLIIIKEANFTSKKFKNSFLFADDKIFILTTTRKRTLNGILFIHRIFMVYYGALGESISFLYLHSCGFIIFKAVIIKMFRNIMRFRRKTLLFSKKFSHSFFVTQGFEISLTQAEWEWVAPTTFPKKIIFEAKEKEQPWNFHQSSFNN